LAYIIGERIGGYPVPNSWVRRKEVKRKNLVAREEGYVVAAGSPEGGRGGNRETL
jgi:hypothetical protein